MSDQVYITYEWLEEFCRNARDKEGALELALEWARKAAKRAEEEAERARDCEAQLLAYRKQIT